MSGPKTLAPEAIASGEVTKPPFSFLPDPATRFHRHARRFTTLAQGHQLEAYLRFLAHLSQAQHQCQDSLPPALPPPAAQLERAYGHGMPPVSIEHFQPGETASRILLAIAALLRDSEMPDAARAALGDIVSMDEDGRRAMMRAVVEAEVPADEIAGHVFAAAAVQVHFSRLAARLEAGRLSEIAPGACPSCGGGPVASVVVELPKVSGHRYCCCSLCGTLWNVSRIRCVLCGGDKGIAYHNIEGVSDTIRAETCDSCSAYVKIFHQDRDPALDPVADDVASLGLDLLMREEGFRRGSANPFLLGY